SPLFITQSDLSLVIQSGSKLICSVSSEQDKAITINGGASNINISAYGAEVISPKVFTTGEWRHMVNITWASNVNIFGLKANGGGGDGYYIGNSEENKLPTRIILTDCIAVGSRRNGISIINGETIHCYNPFCENIIGTS